MIAHADRLRAPALFAFGSECGGVHVRRVGVALVGQPMGGWFAAVTETTAVVAVWTVHPDHLRVIAQTIAPVAITMSPSPSAKAIVTPMMIP